MEYRAGKCSQCGAEYQVPASFAHNVARCKKCRGVVHLSAAPRAPGASAGKAPSPPASLRPAEKVAPEPVAARETELVPPAHPGSAPVAAHESSAPRVPAPSRPPKPRAGAPTEGSPRARAGAKAAQSEPEPERKRMRPLVAAILGGLGLLVVVAALYFLRKRTGAADDSPGPDVTSPAPGTGASPSQPASSEAGQSGSAGGSAVQSGG